MSEPITPKADHHVVEGEFIDRDAESKADANSKADNTHKKTTEDNRVKRAVRNKSTWSWFVVMIVSGAAFALALISWLSLQPLIENQRNLAQLEQHVYALEQQVQKNQAAQDAQQLQLNEMHQAWQDLIERFDAQLTQVSAAEGGEDDNAESPHSVKEYKGLVDTGKPLANSDTDVKNKISDSSGVQSLQDELDIMQQRFNQELQSLNARFTELVEAAQQQVTEADIAAVNNQVQELETELQQQLLQMNQQIINITEQQVEFAAKIAPKVEQIVTEIRPGLDGLMSRFNQLFTIKKHAPDAAETQP